MSEKIKAFKLLTGEVVIGELVDEYIDAFILRNAITLSLIPAHGGAQVSANKWPEFCSDDKISLPKKNVLIGPYSVLDNLKNMYNETYGTGIVVPQKSPIIGV